MLKYAGPEAAALLNYASAARYLGGLSRSGLKLLVGRGELKVVHLGRRALFRRADLDALIERKSREPAA